MTTTITIIASLILTLSTPQPVISQEQAIINYITYQAQQNNIDPDVAINIAMCESSLDPRAKNKTSSAEGLWQFTTPTWNDYCEGDKTNIIDSTTCFMNVYKKHPTWWDCHSILYINK